MKLNFKITTVQTLFSEGIFNCVKIPNWFKLKPFSAIFKFSFVLTAKKIKNKLP